MAQVTPEALERLLAKALRDPSAIWHSPRHCEWTISGNCEMPTCVDLFARSYGHTRDRVVRTESHRPWWATLWTRCRRCTSCLIARCNEWASRSVREYTMAERTWFLTLTMRPERWHMLLSEARNTASLHGVDFSSCSLDVQFRETSSLLGSEITRYLKRVRKVHGPFRYVCVFERHKSGVPHAHLLVHEGASPLRYSTLTSQWTWGFSQAKLVKDRGAVRYVSKYLSKGASARVRASLRYGKRSQILEENDHRKGNVSAERAWPSSAWSLIGTGLLKVSKDGEYQVSWKRQQSESGGSGFRNAASIRTAGIDSGDNPGTGTLQRQREERRESATAPIVEGQDGYGSRAPPIASIAITRPPAVHTVPRLVLSRLGRLGDLPVVSREQASQYTGLVVVRRSEWGRTVRNQREWGLRYYRPGRCAASEMGLGQLAAVSPGRVHDWPWLLRYVDSGYPQPEPWSLGGETGAIHHSYYGICTASWGPTGESGCSMDADDAGAPMVESMASAGGPGHTSISGLGESYGTRSARLGARAAAEYRAGCSEPRSRVRKPADGPGPTERSGLDTTDSPDQRAVAPDATTHAVAGYLALGSTSAAAWYASFAAAAAASGDLASSNALVVAATAEQCACTWASHAAAARSETGRQGHLRPSDRGRSKYVPGYAARKKSEARLASLCTPRNTYERKERSDYTRTFMGPFILGDELCN